MDPISGLAYGRVGLGLVSLLAPRLAAKMLLLDPELNPQLLAVTRMFGSREIAVGGLTLAASGAAREQLVQVGVAIDGADVLTGLVAAVSGAVPKKAGLLIAAVALGAVATGVQGLQDS